MTDPRERSLEAWVPDLKSGSVDRYSLQSTTVWSFPERGSWGGHRGDYPGNWSPHVPRNLILRYSKPGDLVLDPMMGSGTTLIECGLLGRRGLGFDIDPGAVELAVQRIGPSSSFVQCERGNARSLKGVGDSTVNLLATHPPYWSIIRYSNEVDDLSRSRTLSDFLAGMGEVAREAYRVVKPDGHCAILIGDTRRRRHYIPLSCRVLLSFLEVGFVLKEDIIKLQWNMRGTRARWKGRRDFHLIAHEHLFVFRKPVDDKDARVLVHSRRWW